MYPDYVLQRALTVADDEQKAALISKMKPHLVSLRKRAGQSRHLIASTWAFCDLSVVIGVDRVLTSSRTTACKMRSRVGDRVTAG